MYTLSIITGIIFILIFFVLATGYVLWFGTMLKTKGTPTINTFPRHYKLLQQLTIPPGSSLIDLGCGTGAALRFFAKTFPKLQLSGIDLNKIAITRGKRKNKKQGYTNIDLQVQNIFDVNIQSYDYIYLFLMPNVMSSVEKWLEKDLNSHTIVICNSFALPNRKPKQILSSDDGKVNIYIYKRGE